MNNKQKTKINYQKSGVSIDRADKLISSLKSKNINKDKNVLSNIGGFSSLYKIDTKIKDPVIVSGTDGVGTKLKSLISLNAINILARSGCYVCE